MAKKGFGRLQKDDPRDRQFPVRMLVKKRSKRVSRFWNDLRWFGDQGAKPHCVGYAWVGWIEDGPIRPTGKKVPAINPSNLYNEAQKVDEWPGTDYEGTSVRAGAKVLQSMGLIESYLWAFKLDEVVDAILEQGPVVVGTDWYDGMMDPAKNGFLQASGEIVGGHAYLLNGVNRKLKYFRIKNSWSRRWGQSGRAKISFDDFDKLLHAQGEACLAVELLKSGVL